MQKYNLTCDFVKKKKNLNKKKPCKLFDQKFTDIMFAFCPLICYLFAYTNV